MGFCLLRQIKAVPLVATLPVFIAKPWNCHRNWSSLGKKAVDSAFIPTKSNRFSWINASNLLIFLSSISRVLKWFSGAILSCIFVLGKIYWHHQALSSDYFLMVWFLHIFLKGLFSICLIIGQKLVFSFKFLSRTLNLFGFLLVSKSFLEHHMRDSNF